MEVGLVIDIGRQALITVLIISGPMLLGGLFVGLAVGIFQAVTQIHEMTLTFIPKILTMVGILVALLPWMLVKYVDFVNQLFEQLPELIR